jgi:acyl-CoA synthetase (AMP-forming)/AMP-acid ligase II
MLMLAYWPADRSFPVLDITVGDMLREAAAAAPGATALVAGNPGPSDRRRWTYTELLEQSEQAARALLGRFEPGERVAVWANNIPEWVMLEFAAALAGITIVTVNPALRAGAGPRPRPVESERRLPDPRVPRHPTGPAA